MRFALLFRNVGGFSRRESPDIPEQSWEGLDPGRPTRASPEPAARQRPRALGTGAPHPSRLTSPDTDLSPRTNNGMR
jgi:hypothetical protein